MPSHASARRAAWLSVWLVVAVLLAAATGPLWLAAAASLGIGGKAFFSHTARWAGWLLPFVVLLPVRAPLENENRQRILAYIDQHPGASIQQVRRHIGVAWGTAVYHLDRLRKDGLLVSHRHGNHHRYWSAAAPEARLRRGWSVLQQPTTRDIAMAVAAQPGMHQSAICEELDVRAPNASKHLSRLERHGLVAKRRVSRFAVYEPTEALQELLRLQAPARSIQSARPPSSHTTSAGDPGQDGGQQAPPTGSVEQGEGSDLLRR